MIGFTLRSNAQSVEGVSVLTSADGNVNSYSATAVDYVASLYYNVYTEGTLFEQGNLVQSGTASGNPLADGYLNWTGSTFKRYQVQTNHYVVAFFVEASSFYNPYGFGYASNDGYGQVIFGPIGAPIYVVASYIYLGSTALEQLAAPSNPAGVVLPDDSPLAEVQFFASTMSKEQIRQNVLAWNAAVIAAIQTNSQQKAVAPEYNWPQYVTVSRECYTNGGRCQQLLATLSETEPINCSMCSEIGGLRQIRSQ